jgi:hypothetical protein
MVSKSPGVLVDEASHICMGDPLCPIVFPWSDFFCKEFDKNFEFLQTL